MSDLLTLAHQRVLAAIPEPTGFVAYPAGPIDGPELDLVESRFGFPLPPLLKRLYMEVGNGGFGPGYGLLGLGDGFRDDQGDTALESYELRRETDPSELGWNWPAGLLPICTWGCAIYSCIECSKPTAFPMVIFDPNVHVSRWDECLFPECESFDEWIAIWVGGGNLWDRMYGSEGTVSIAIEKRRGVRSGEREI
jgi:hypothetical protein